jgi:CHAT domain-containing protein/Flp pilus assembly protein TadD
MRHSAKLFGLMAGTALIVSASQVPGLSGEFRHLTAQAVAQTTQADDPATVLLEVEGVLEAGDATLDDGSLYDIHPIEGQARQAITIRLESNDFDTYLMLIDSEGQEIAANDDVSSSTTNSQLAVTLPADGTYGVVANALDESGRGGYRLMVSVMTEAEARKTEADQLLQQGIEQYDISQFREAVQSLEQALAIYREINDRTSEGPILGVLGLAYTHLNKHQEAIHTFEERLDIARELGDRMGEGFTLGNLGVVYRILGDYQRAISLHEQHLNISREVGNREEEQLALLNLGIAYEKLGENQISIDYAEQSLYVSRAIGDPEGELEALINLGKLYSKRGQYQQAIEALEEGLIITHELGNKNLSIFIALGTVYDNTGQYQDAIDYYSEALIIARAIGDHQGEGAALGNLAISHHNSGEYQQAISYYEQHIAIARQTGDRFGESDSLGNLGITYLTLNNYQLAIDLFEQQLVMARDIEHRQGEAAALGSLGRTYLLLNEYPKAISMLEENLALSREVGNREFEAGALSDLGTALRKNGEFKRSENFLYQAISAFESMRRGLPDSQLISLIDTQTQAYRSLTQTLMAQGKVNEALKISEQGRAQAFALQLIGRLRQTSDDSIFATPEPIALEQIQQIARDTNTTLVTYSLIFAQALYIWVVQPSGDIEFRSVEFEGSGDTGLAINPIASIDGPVYRGATDDSELTTLVNDSRASIVVEGADTSPEQLKELHQVLIDPIADLLPTDSEAKVAFIPQGSLFLVPFAALQDEEGTYLIEKHTILTAPSIQVFGLANEASRGTGNREQGTEAMKNALIVGNPVMPTVWAPTASGDFAETQLSNLPGAKQEAETIGEFFNIPVLTGEQATEARIKQQLSSAQLIHLATHGLLDYGDPQSYGTLDVPGAIALAPGNGEDGLLTSAEILDMDLQADLAILSACDTGRGRITGDGVVGLSRSLITAGVPSVVVSLWAVPDAPTAELMTEFYRQLDQGQDKAQALRQAMLTTMEQHSNPRDWAAFTLIGAAE